MFHHTIDVVIVSFYQGKHVEHVGSFLDIVQFSLYLFFCSISEYHRLGDRMQIDFTYKVWYPPR